MAKATPDVVFDAALGFVQSNSQRQIACSAEPANYAGVAAVALADIAVAGVDFTIADNEGGGRKATLGAKSGAVIDTSGTATHVVLVDDTNTRLIEVTTCTSQALTANGSNTVNFPAWAVRFSDPT